MLEYASIIVLGILAQWIAWRTKVPAILPLIIIGLLVGPISTLFMDGGEKFIEPIWNPETNHGLFPGESLFYFVSLSIGIILFEGGLTLKRSEIKDVGPSILKLITLGSLITFILSGLAAWGILGISPTIAFLFGALIIVTGPTVIAPILRNVPLNKNVSTVLKWEGILIDPIGALTAVLVFEFINAGGDHFTAHALKQFGLIVAVGAGLGSLSAYGLYLLLKNHLIPHYLINVFTLALVLMVFVVSDELVHESGLLTVVLMGLILGNLDLPNFKEILYFKESLSILLISILFILLSANIELVDLQQLLHVKYLLLFLAVILVIRPLAVFASTINSNLNLNEKLFISWMGPRGIVAAGIASLFGLKLTLNGVEYASLVAPLVFMIVLGTVLLNATTANLVARMLKVIQEAANGILIIGAHKASRLIAKYLDDNGRQVVVVDNNASNIDRIVKEGLNGQQYDIYSDGLSDNYELNDIGYIMAMTGSNEVNKFAINKYGEELGSQGAYRLISAKEMKDTSLNPTDGLFSQTDDYINLSEVARDYPSIHELPVNNSEELKSALEAVYETTSAIPLFVKQSNGKIDIITSNVPNYEVQESSHFVYLGKNIDKTS